jgi:hypothetical protein
MFPLQRHPTRGPFIFVVCFSTDSLRMQKDRRVITQRERSMGLLRSPCDLQMIQLNNVGGYEEGSGAVGRAAMSIEMDSMCRGATITNP